MSDEDDLEPHDREALELAMKVYAAKERQGAEHIKAMLEGKPDPGSPGEWFIPPLSWQEAAEDCANHMQRMMLKLKPWEEPPCQIPEEWIETGAPPNTENPIYSWYYHRAESLPAAVALARRMKDAGISLWHPDPLKALREAEVSNRPARSSELGHGIAPRSARRARGNDRAPGAAG
jgi:hypothetical protein